MLTITVRNCDGTESVFENAMCYALEETGALTLVLSLTNPGRQVTIAAGQWLSVSQEPKE